MCRFSTAAVLLRPGGARGARHRQRSGARRRGSRSRRDADGTPTGWITGDNRTISDLFNLLPRPSFAQKVAGTRAFFRALNALGLTGVIDPGGYNLPIPDYRRCSRSGATAR